MDPYAAYLKEFDQFLNEQPIKPAPAIQHAPSLLDNIKCALAEQPEEYPDDLYDLCATITRAELAEIIGLTQHNGILNELLAGICVRGADDMAGDLVKAGADFCEHCEESEQQAHEAFDHKAKMAVICVMNIPSDICKEIGWAYLRVLNRDNLIWTL